LCKAYKNNCPFATFAALKNDAGQRRKAIYGAKLRQKDLMLYDLPQK
jgi:hypothetical protein